MGTAVLFLLALDALILTGPYGQRREVVALGITIVVVASILLIWVRNTRLERALRVKGKASRGSDGR